MRRRRAWGCGRRAGQAGLGGGEGGGGGGGSAGAGARRGRAQAESWARRARAGPGGWGRGAGRAGGAGAEDRELGSGGGGQAGGLRALSWARGAGRETRLESGARPGNLTRAASCQGQGAKGDLTFAPRGLREASGQLITAKESGAVRAGGGGRVGAGIWCEGDQACRASNRRPRTAHVENCGWAGGTLGEDAVIKSPAPPRCLKNITLIEKKKGNGPDPLSCRVWPTLPARLKCSFGSTTLRNCGDSDKAQPSVFFSDRKEWEGSQSIQRSPHQGFSSSHSGRVSTSKCLLIGNKLLMGYKCPEQEY